VKKILVTQRVDIVDSYQERRDALDQRWVALLRSINLLPLLVPNNIKYVQALIVDQNIDGVLFTGGNSLSVYGGDASERDEVEMFLLDWAITQSLPILGVCRGMQLIQTYFGNKLQRVAGHVASRHKLEVIKGKKFSYIIEKMPDVNSYHEYGTKQTTGALDLVASSSDGVVMALEHKTYGIFAMMWHPERERILREEDLEIIKKIFS